MPKVKRPQIAGPAYDDDRDEAPPPRAPSRPSRRARDIPYSVAWFRDRIATYALGTIICGAVDADDRGLDGRHLGAFGQRMNNGFNVIAGWAGISVKDVKVCANREVDATRACRRAGPADGEVLAGCRSAEGDKHPVAPIPMRSATAIEKTGCRRGQRAAPVAGPHRASMSNSASRSRCRRKTARAAPGASSTRAAAPFAEADLAKYAQPAARCRQGRRRRPPARWLRRWRTIPNLAERMEIAYRVSGRRWDMKFKGRTDVVVVPGRCAPAPNSSKRST